MEYKALYDFNPNDSDELPFKKGQVLKVIRREDKHWLLALNGSKQGLVPENYVKEVKTHEWFVGKIPRKTAEEYLLAMPKDGAFMVRDSESNPEPNNFSLSVKFQNAVQHFKILTDPVKKYFLWVVKFNSLNELVAYHENNSVSRTQHICLGDACVLPPEHNMSTLLPVDGSLGGPYAGDNGGMMRAAMAAAPPQQKPKEETKCKALYDFESDVDNELTFKKGEIITLVSQPHQDWWEGEVRSDMGGVKRHGIFPRTYVSVLNPASVNSRGY